LTLLEILVSVTLLIVIMGGLMLMFDQTQKVFVTGLRQVDVLEGGRAAADLVGRDFEQMAAGGRSGDTNFYADFRGWPGDTPAEILEPGAGNTVQELFLQEAFFLTRANDWSAIGYRVLDPNAPNAAPLLMGALYRYTTNSVALHSTNFFGTFLNELPNTANSRLVESGQMSRVIDGVVHFKVIAYDSRGFRFATTNVTDLEIFEPNEPDPAPYYAFRGKTLPSAVEIEIGILEPEAVIRARALPGTGTAYTDNLRRFLGENSGKIHLFRQRIPIRVAASLGN
jgi:hypothetical protein